MGWKPYNAANMAQFATISGWGKCMPPATLTNADLATFLDTDDEWIRTRTGIHERRVSHAHGRHLHLARQPVGAPSSRQTGR